MVGLRRVLSWSALIAVVGGCAASTGGQGGTPAGGSGGSGATATTSSTSTTTSATGGAGGTTSTTDTGGTTTSTTGGAGGATTTSTTDTGSTTTSTTGGGGAGGMAPTEASLVFANSAVAVLGAAQHPGGSWSVALPGVGSTHAPATVLLDAEHGIGLYRAAADGMLTYVAWSSGTFAPPLAIGGLHKSMDAPSMTAWNGGAAAVYHKDDFKHYFALYKPGSGWSPVAEPILANNVHSFGPTPPSIAIVGGDVVIAYAGDNNNLYDQTRSAGVWQPSVDHGVTGTVQLTPKIVAIPSGASDAMIAYVRKADAQVMFTLRAAVNGAWSPPAPVPSAFTNDPVGLASTGTTGAMLAFRGTNGNLYTCSYDPANNPPWSTPAAFGSSVASSPAVARGVGGHDAEMVWVSGLQIQHASFAAGAWSAAEVVGGVEINGVSLATYAP